MLAMLDSVFDNLNDFWLKVDKTKPVWFVEADHCKARPEGVNLVQWDEEHCVSAALKVWIHNSIISQFFKLK